MVYAIYIAAAAVTGILIGLTALSVGFLQKTVTKNIRARTVDLIAVYDALLEEKSNELSALRSQIKETNASMQNSAPRQAAVPASADRNMNSGAILNTVERIGGVAYRDSSAGNLYQTIKENFSFDFDQVQEKFCEENWTQGPAGKLLDTLSFDAVYELSALNPDAQIQVLREVLPEDSIALLDQYVQQKGQFRIIEFYDYLKAAAWTEPQPARMRMSQSAAQKVQSACNKPGIEVIADDSICEGYQIEMRHVLHDYSIRTGELH